jgi:hypothetical protein
VTSNGRTAVVFVVGALFAAGMSTVVYLRERDEDRPRTDVALLRDASSDAHATSAKPKLSSKKKPRGGKTRVIGRPSGGPHSDSHPHPSAAHATSTAGIPIGSTADEGDPGRDEAPASPAPHVRRRHYAGPSGPSYESALDSNNQQVAIGTNAGHDLSDAQLSAPMSDGSFLDECGTPENMSITVKVAVKMGRAVGVSVSTEPSDRDVAACIDHRVRALSWPASPKMDSFVTTY